jgi:hypothetical protein
MLRPIRFLSHKDQEKNWIFSPTTTFQKEKNRKEILRRDIGAKCGYSYLI